MGGQRRANVKLLLDTGAILALVWKKDRNHQAARRFVRDNPRTRWVVSDLLIAEVATRVRARENAGQAVRVASNIVERMADVVYCDRDLLRSALGTMERFSDKRLSVADCLSFVLIERLALDGAFTFDRDVQDCGFASHP
jgi:predicted nucleic acid-binding protein